MIYRVELKKKCSTCKRETKSSARKFLHIGNKRVEFYICLECGNPYGYKSFNQLISSQPKKAKSIKPKNQERKRSKTGKAGLMKSSYKLYLQTNHWKKIRDRKLGLNPYCEVCKDKKATQVHHLRYQDDNGDSTLYHERMEDLTSVCAECHSKIHKITDKI